MGLLWIIGGLAFVVGMIFFLVALTHDDKDTLFTCASVVIGCTILVCVIIFYRPGRVPQERQIEPHETIGIDGFVEYMQTFAEKDHFMPKDIDDAKGFFLRKFHDIAYAFKKEKDQAYSGSVQEAIMRAAKAYFEGHAA